MEILPLITGIILSLTGLLYFGLIGLFTYGWYRSKSTLRSRTGSIGIKISVIIAARNEENSIADLLDDLMVQDYPPALMEVVVVDDHSADGTAAVVKNFLISHKLSGYKLLKSEDYHLAGKKEALTLGVTESAGDLILVTDADCRLGPGWVSTLAAYFDDKAKVMVFGPVAYIHLEGVINRFQSLEFSGLMASGAGAAGAGYPFICNGASLAYRKSAFLQVNGFEGNKRFISGDDVFLMHKMKKKFGSKAIGFARDKRLLVQTYPASGLAAFLKQRIRWASKSKGYGDPLALATALIVFAYNFMLSVTFFAGFFSRGFFLLFTGFILLKSMIDLPLMWGVTGFTGSRQLMKWYLPFQIVYPFYIMVAGILGLFNRKKW